MLYYSKAGILKIELIDVLAVMIQERLGFIDSIWMVLSDIDVPPNGKFREANTHLDTTLKQVLRQYIVNKSDYKVEDLTIGGYGRRKKIYPRFRFK